ncbi:MAG: hypothetical protein ICV59_09765 [Thermoleophilia bacterium]|nr:hypothetical protein [Thermoleophilia bacterium]
MSALAPPELGLESCPRCAADVEPAQEYCLECGARLPLVHGVLTALAGAWRARVRWYPGDWIWAVLLLLAVAAAAATVAIVVTDDEQTRALPVVATSDRPAPAQQPRRQATSTPAPATRRTGTGRGAAAPAETTKKPATLVEWPTGQSAYTVVLVSLPSTAGAARARRIARRASRAGLPDVGFLDSSKYPSLHPGYFVVFTGVYESADDAASALAEAHRLGFPRAYTRQIVA